MERITEYTSLPQEPINNCDIPESWPDRGSISIRGLQVQYTPESPLVLNGISLEILPCEKVAVVGRTGAGKSSFASAIFRMVPIVGGYIAIDGVDVTKISLRKLRSNLTIIPQDPVLFSGTLRSNLDPTNRFEDARIWDILKRVHFLDTTTRATSSTPLVTNPEFSISLDMNLSENGENFSLGQRQLLCLARSLLQGNRIIFLDEATASIDAVTDCKIQQTIRKEFAKNTIICIAHRLRTIIDYDKVLVLENGRTKELGNPGELIKDQNSYFHRLCKESGDFELLYEQASSSQNLMYNN